MSCDKRTYVPVRSRKTEKPIAPTGGKNAAADGYSIRHREPMEYQNDGYAWSRDRTVSPGLRDVDTDPYFMD
jgi:hypothetical protein